MTEQEIFAAMELLISMKHYQKRRIEEAREEQAFYDEMTINMQRRFKAAKYSGDTKLVQIYEQAAKKTGFRIDEEAEIKDFNDIIGDIDIGL